MFLFCLLVLNLLPRITVWHTWARAACGSFPGRLFWASHAPPWASPAPTWSSGWGWNRQQVHVITHWIFFKYFPFSFPSPVLINFCKIVSSCFTVQWTIEQDGSGSLTLAFQWWVSPCCPAHLSGCWSASDEPHGGSGSASPLLPEKTTNISIQLNFLFSVVFPFSKSCEMSVYRIQWLEWPGNIPSPHWQSGSRFLSPWHGLFL